MLSAIRLDGVRADRVNEYLGRMTECNLGYLIDATGSMTTLYLRESGLRLVIPSSRVSDGTLRFICLLVAIFQENPPSVICLEEPEIGLHPDMIHVLADLLIEASQRTQLVVSTHSDRLVSAIGAQHPEAVLVCEKDEEGTKLRRLDPEQLQAWLEEYTLGELWLKGNLGGKRW